MKPDRTRLLLNALADGELSRWTAAHVRRHLQTCAACRAEYAQIQALGAQAREWRAVAAPAGLQTRLAEALRQLPDTEKEAPMPSTVVPFAPSRPRPAVRWQPLTGAAALAAALVGAALLLPGSPGRPSIAFADVQRAMEAVQTASWTQTQTRYDLRGTMTLHNTQRIWLRRDPPAYAEQDSASSLPQVPGGEYAGLTHYVSNSLGQINFHVHDGVYYLHPARDIARQVQDTIDSLVSARGETPGRAERVTLDGRPALFFHQHFHVTLGAVDEEGQKTPPAYRVMDGDESFWVAPDTLCVLRKHSDMVWGPQRIVQDAHDFQYGRSAPAGVFEISLPPGARVTKDDGHGNKTVLAPHGHE